MTSESYPVAKLDPAGLSLPCITEPWPQPPKVSVCSGLDVEWRGSEEGLEGFRSVPPRKHKGAFS